MKFRLTLFTSALAILFCSYQAFGTHLRSGQINVQQLGVGDSRFKITIQVWTSTKNTDVLFGGDQDYLDFGDGTTRVLVPTQQNIMIDVDRGVGYAEYSIIHTYPGRGKYVVSYTEPNRNVGILNMSASGESNFYLETSFVLDPLSAKAYATPEFLTPTMFFGSASLGYSFSLAAKDVNDYTLFYQLDVPRQNRHLPVAGYIIPGNLAVNPFNGLITWDGIFQGLPTVGEFTIAVKTYQFYEGVMVGYVLRDVQIILDYAEVEGEISDDQEPEPNGRIFVDENQTREIQISATSTVNEVALEAFSSLGPDNYSFEVSEAQGQATGTIKLTSTAAIVRDNPYMITVRATMGGLARDINYLVYTKDIQPTEPVVLGSDEGVYAKSIYPNPVRDFLQIDLPNTRNVTVAIVNQQGVRVQQHTIAVDNSVDLRTLPSGIYVCEVREGSNLIVRKRIVKE